MAAIGKKNKFKDRGVIVKIQLKNFITYSDVYINPGRNLNLIIGPNGTGKSTIVTAIALGFGGTPKLIGKANMSVSDTIKAGTNSARIDLTVRDTETTNKTFSRTIDMNNKSTWFIDDQHVTMAKFKETVNDFNIQVDNLTQFLPQENIKGFSELNGKQLLMSTERSVADTSLEKQHELLIANRQRQRMLEEELIRKTERLEALQQRNVVLTEEVNQLHERKNLKKKLQYLRQKRAWIIYDNERQKLEEANERRKQAANDMKTFDERLAPIDKEIKELEAKSNLIDRKVDQNNQKLISSKSEYRGLINTFEHFNVMIKDEEKKCEREIERENQRDKNIQSARRVKEGTENNLLEFEEQHGSEINLKQQIQQIDTKIDTQKKIIQTLSQEFDSKKSDTEQLVYQITNMKREQQILQDVETKRLNILMAKSRDAYEGIKWLRENSHLFKKKVWEPMMLHIQVKENTYAKYFENVISQRDLIAFVCEDKDDMAVLLRNLRNQKNLKVNVVHSDPQRYISMNPKISLNEIKRYGFTNYLIDLVEAPEPVLKYIVQMYNIHNIPIGGSKVDHLFEQIPSSLTTFFSETKSYYVSRSKYSGEKSTKICDINKTGTLSMILDTSKIRAFEEKIFRLNQEKETVVANYHVLEDKISKEREQLDKLREQKAKQTGYFQRHKSITSNLRIAEQNVIDLESERMNIDDIQKKKKKIIKNLLSKQMNSFEEINQVSEKSFDILKMCKVIVFQLKTIRNQITSKESESSDLRENVKKAEKLYKELDSKHNDMKKTTQAYLETARQMTNGFTPQNKEGFRPFNAAFSKLPIAIEEIDEMIDQTKAKVYCTRDNPDIENILNEHEKIKEKIQSYEEQLESMKIELQTNQEETEIIKNQWLPPLKALVSKISSNFGNYLASAGCAGEVYLIHGDNPNNFDEYELKIKVKFRAEEPLEEFTKNRQSGGETSLTTAMYMLALQEMSTVPFRCVDEINQGMDATNDRKVFERIMDITAKTNSSQYFLLTPKLLPKLHYNDTVTVLCVLNGPYVVSQHQWNIDDYCKSLMKKKKQREREITN